jgi:hypothetical protein
MTRFVTRRQSVHGPALVCADIARKPRLVVRPLMSDRPRTAARGLTFGLEDRNDRKFGDTRGL